MRLQIRGSQNVQFDIEVADGATVLDLKKAIADLRQLDSTKIRLIYSGKILADNQTLESYHITDGHAIHMVVSGARAARPAAPQPAPAQPSPSASVPSDPLPQATPPPQANPFAAGGGMGGFPGMGGMGGFPGMGGLPGMGGMPNMEQIQQMMNSPYVQQMMEQIEQNPELLRQAIDSNPMFANNPMMRQMADQLASNPEMIRQSMNMMRGAGGAGGAGAANPFGMDFNAMMQNPEIQRMMNDPAIMQQAASMMGGLNPFGGFPTPPPAAPTANADRDLFLSITGLEDNADLQTRLATADGQSGLRQLIAGCRALRRAGINVFPDVEGLAAPAPAAPAPSPVPPAPQISNEERFAEQLRIMNEMGLNDNAKNIQALLASNGNVNVAIERIFSGM